ncbi:MAG: hypothetical protein OEX81_05020 [Candidatus Pacebacteria bacterium]|nr:hypothetical protein [Candidatus Paceibacterota bacterium]
MKHIPLLAKVILTTVVASGVAIGSYSYVKKTNPGLVLGTTNDVKDFIEEKVPQSKPILDKILPEENKEDGEVLGEETTSSEDTSKKDLEAENTFLKESLEMTKKQIETLTEKSEEVKEHLLNLSDEIREASNSAPIHEKAFEYGQYVYCQEVVKEYETN